jgi:phosphatidylglycerophosphate synthase
MVWNIPNILTLGRIVLAAGFFVLLGLYDYAHAGAQALMGASFVLFVTAAVTDFFDGFLARRLKQLTAFGRIADPFVDKVLVVGTFVMLAGPNFAASPNQLGEMEASLPGWMTGGMASSVQTWMVVVILAREFVVSAIRGYSESQGRKFPAIAAGKIKMFLQSIAIGAVLFTLSWAPRADWAVIVKIASIWAALLATVFSGLIYVYKARNLLLAGESDA